MKTTTTKKAKGRAGTHEKYKTAVKELLSYIANRGGSAPAEKVDQLLRSLNVTFGITTAAKDGGLVTITRKSFKNKKGSRVTYHITPEAMAGDYNLDQIINNYREKAANRALESAKRKREREQGKSFTDNVRPESNTVLQSKGVQLQLLIDADQFTGVNAKQFMTFEDWFTEIKRLGYVILKTV